MEPHDFLKADKEMLFSEWDRTAIPLPPAIAHSPLAASRVGGMLLGLAIGDALGNSSEGIRPERRHSLFGEIHSYLPSLSAGNRAVGLPSDETQLAFWTLESLLRCGRLDPTDLAETYSSSEIFGVGNTMRGFLLVWTMQNVLGPLPWCEAGQPSNGNDALSRIPAVILPHVRRPSRALWDDVICATALTHRGRMTVAAAVGYAGLLMECLSRGPAVVSDLQWFPETFARYASCLETDDRAEADDPDAGHLGGRGLCRTIQRVIPGALQKTLSAEQACRSWGSGSDLRETIPSVLYILVRYGGDPEEAIVRAVNDCEDNDSVAALVGAAVGALHGERSFPERWRKGLLGRTRSRDDGHVHELIVDALGAFIMGEMRP